MKFTRERPEGIYTIHAHHSGGIQVNSPSQADPRDEDGRLWLEQGLIITPHWLHHPWRPSQLDELNDDDLSPLRQGNVEVLLIGTGPSLRFPSTATLARLVGLGVGYEIMDTAAACRTYNILAAEGRKVAAILL